MNGHGGAWVLMLLPQVALAGETLGAWTELPRRIHARAEGQVVVLHDDPANSAGVRGVLLVGGFGGPYWEGGPVTTDCEYLDLTTPGAVWVECAPVPEPIAMTWAIELESGNVLVAGSFTATTDLKSFVYDPSADEWHVVADKPAAAIANPHSVGNAVRLADGNVLVAGGYGPPLFSARAFEFTEDADEPDQGTWTEVGPLPFRSGTSRIALLASGDVLHTGGYRTLGTSGAESAVYDPDTATWRAGPDMLSCDDPACGDVRNDINPGSRWAPGIAALPDGDAIVVGGSTRGPGIYYARRDALRWDAATGDWVSIARARYPRNAANTVTLPDGRVFVTGGHWKGMAEIYDPATDTWSDAGSYGGTLPACAPGHPSNPSQCLSIDDFGGQLRLLDGGRVLQTCGYDPTKPYPDITCDRAFLWTPAD